MNAYNKYFNKLVELEAAGEYLEYFDEWFDTNYKGEGDPEGDAAFEAFEEIIQEMFADGNLSEDYI